MTILNNISNITISKAQYGSSKKEVYYVTFNMNELSFYLNIFSLFVHADIILHEELMHSQGSEKPLACALFVIIL